MSANTPILLRHLFAVLMVAVAASAVAEEPLWFVRGAASDPYGNTGLHYSFLPSETAAPGGREALVWLPVRKAAWTKIVEDCVSVPRENVVLLGEDESFPFRTESDGGQLLEPGMNGFSVVAGPNGSVRTNPVEIVKTEMGLRARPSDSVAGLFPIRGAGRELWFVSESDLENRWRTNTAERVREEIKILTDVWKKDQSESGKAHYSWLFQWRIDHPKTWPKLVFDNRAGTNATVRIGAKTRELAADEQWPVSFETKPDFRLLKTWSYRVAGQSAEDEEDMEPCKEIDWNPAKDQDVVVRLEKRKLKTGKPTLNVRTLFPDSFDPDLAGFRPEDLVAEIRYAGETEFRPLEPTPTNKWIRQIEPRRMIDAVRIGENAFFCAEETLLADKASYPFGPREARLLRRKDDVRVDAKLVYRGWPAVSVTNVLDDRPVAVEATFVGPSGETISPVSFELSAGSAARRIRPPDRTFAPNGSRIDVRFRTTAEKAAFKDETVSLVRGDPVVLFEPKPAELQFFETDSYPEEKNRIAVGSDLFGVLSSISLANRLGGTPKRPESLFSGATGETIRSMLAHKRECRRTTCPDCQAFREALERVGCPADEEPDRVDAALVCALEYLGKTKRLAGEKRDVELARAKSLLEPFRERGTERTGP